LGRVKKIILSEKIFFNRGEDALAQKFFYTEGYGARLPTAQK
jgi:hypothetical protein